MHLSSASDFQPLRERNDTDNESSFAMNEGTMTVEAMKQVEQGWATADGIAGRMVVYTEDSIFDCINVQPAVGIDAIQANYEAMAVEESTGSLDGQIATFENRAAVVMGNWGYTSGTWTVEKPDGHVDKGNYLHVIKLVDGEAKMFRQIFDVTERS